MYNNRYSNALTDRSMKPGVYDISIDEYHSSLGISRSGIAELKKSPLHYYDKYINQNRQKDGQTKSLRIGDIVHTLVLEPEKLATKYVIEPAINKRTKAGQVRYQEFLAENSDKQIIANDEYLLASRVAASIIEHPIASQFITSGQIEKSIYWEDKETGALCKARPDVLHDKVIVDLKTTQCASKEAFQRSVYNYNYHIQAAMCLDASASIGKPFHSNFVFIAVETERPHAVAAYVLQDEAIDIGRQEYKRLLEVYADCKAKDEWPGYSAQVQDISLPRYAFI